MRFNVDPPELHKASGKFTDLAGQYRSVHTRLINTASTMGEAWKSADNLAFVERITGFCEELNNMTKHLEQAAAALEKQATNYETVRENNITVVNQLTN
jgi:WXG100 family type VII secretion target